MGNKKETIAECNFIADKSVDQWLCLFWIWIMNVDVFFVISKHNLLTSDINLCFFHVRESWLTALEWRKPSIYNSKAALFLAPRPCHMFTTTNQSHIKQSATNPVTIGVMGNNFLDEFFLPKTYYGIVAVATYLIKENGVGWLLMNKCHSTKIELIFPNLNLNI